MAETEVFNSKVFDLEYSRRLTDEFCNNTPIRHFVIEDFLALDAAEALFHYFPAIDQMKTHYHGINEKKSEHSGYKNLEACFAQLHLALSSQQFINWLQQVTHIDLLQVIDDRLGYGLHQGANQSFLDIHIDYNLHPIKKLYRKLNLIIFLNPKWESGWGGHLELWDADVKNCVQSIAPAFNRCVVFECSDISYHGYSKIKVPEGITRKSIYQYYFTPAPQHISFHDTIFKPKPEDSKTKKVITYTKDFAKNNAKKIFLNLGWKKFLK